MLGLQVRRVGAVRGTVGAVGAVLVVAGTVTVLAPAAASPFGDGVASRPVAPDPEPTTTARAAGLLDRVATASTAVAYEGTQFVTTWDDGSTDTTLLDVRNVPGEGVAVRVRGGGDGADGSASQVFTTAGSTPIQLGGGPVDLLAEHYTVTTDGGDRVGGRKAHVLVLSGADGLVAARMWVDARSGVLVRREVYDADGRTVRASAFVDLRVEPAGGDGGTAGTGTTGGLGTQPAGHLPPVAPVVPVVELSTADVAALRDDEACACPEQLAGALSLFQVREVESSAGSVLQLSYSDGLSTLSVFEQPGQVPDDGIDGWTAVDDGRSTRYVADGPTVGVVWSDGETVFTVVGDAPAATLQKAVGELPAGVPQDGVADRLARGLARVGSWVNPFA